MKSSTWQLFSTWKSFVKLKMVHNSKCKLERHHNRSYHQESRTIWYAILHFLVLLYFYEVDWYCLMIMFVHIRRNCLPASHLLIPIPITTKLGWNLFTNIGEYVLHDIFRNETWMLIWSLWYMIVLVREWKTIGAKINQWGLDAMFLTVKVTYVKWRNVWLRVVMPSTF